MPYHGRYRLQPGPLQRSFAMAKGGHAAYADHLTPDDRYASGITARLLAEAQVLKKGDCLTMPFRPINASDACIRRSRRLLDLAEHDVPDRKVKNDLRRSALVMAVTAIDSHMHWLVYRRISEVRKEGDLPKALAKLDLPFTEMASLADAIVQGRKVGKDTRPWVQVKNAMQKRLLKDTFQSYEQVAGAFSWAGIEKPWSRVAAKLSVKADDIKLRLNLLVHRRNQIVHEGDIARASRPQSLKYNPITHDEVVDHVNWIESLIGAIEQVVADGNP